MNPDALFLHRYDKMVALLHSQIEADHLDLAAIIRQMLIDHHSLVDTANKAKLRITFKIGVIKEGPPGARPINHVLMDAIDPETPEDWPFAPLPFIMLPRDKFAAHVIARTGDVSVTVKDAVKYASNIAGGVHHDPRTTHDYQAVEALNQIMKVGGVGCMNRMMKPLSIVVLRGLDQLVTDVRRRLSPSPDKHA